MFLKSGWYHPDLTSILEDQKDPSLEIVQELHKASDKINFTLLDDSIDRAMRILSNHTTTVDPINIGLDLPTRTKILQTEINTSYDLLNTLLNNTITTAFDNITTNKSKKKLTHYNLQLKLSELYLSNTKTITSLIDINNNCNPKKKQIKFKTQIAQLKARHHHLNILFTEQKDRCQKLIDNYTTTATDIDIQHQQKRIKTSKEAQPSPSTPASPSQS